LQLEKFFETAKATLHLIKDLHKMAGNSMAMRALYVAIAIVIRSLNPQKLAAYLA